MDSILALERDVELAANARLHEVLLRVGYLLDHPGCQRHVHAWKLREMGIMITRLRRRIDGDWFQASGLGDEARLRDLMINKKALSRVFHATPCTCKES